MLDAFELCWRRLLWRRQWHPTPVLLPGKSHGQRSLVGCHPWGCEEVDTTERLHFHLSLSCIGEGNGNPLQCSCLENSRDGRAWSAAVDGIAQSQTRLKLLSRSISSGRLLRVLWTARRSNQSILKDINPGYSLEGLILMLKLQYFGHLIQRVDLLEKILMLGKIKSKRKRGWQRMRAGRHHQLNGHEFEQTLGDSEGQGRPGGLQLMGSQRVGHDLMT